MKLRLLGNRIRLRLTQSEVNEIGQNQRVVEKTTIGSNVFEYSLGTHISAEAIKSEYQDHAMRITISRTVAQDWVNSDQISIKSNSEANPFILIEKDFKCLTVREGESEEDMFVNPNEVC